MARRKSGILLHPTSLPGPGGIGSLGEECFKFIDLLNRGGQTLWQLLPLGPAAYGYSPYSCYSAFAGNPLLIDLRALVREGDLEEHETWAHFPEYRVDYPQVEQYRMEKLRQAAARFFDSGDSRRREEFASFCADCCWLEDFALFMAIKSTSGGKSWDQWPEELSRREPKVPETDPRFHPEVQAQKYMQWQFFKQWGLVKEFANRSGIEIIGDLPIFVAFDSADVWANPQFFHLDKKGRPLVVAGVPPDYFSKTGQLWGNPLYNWDALSFHGFSWWIERMRSSLKMYDFVRVDHFRGFEAYWEVAATEKTAVNGRWVKGPGEALFTALIDALGPLPLIAEDLGVITPDVEALRDRFSFPGMKILQFAFGSGSDNPYLPHNLERNSVIYTGTHDNDTSVGWFNALSMKERQQVLEYLNADGNEIAWDLIKTAYASVSNTAVVPLQDIMSLDSFARMNRPGSSEGNWAWRFRFEDISDAMVQRMKYLAVLYGRAA